MSGPEPGPAPAAAPRTVPAEVLLDVTAGVATITLNRPDPRNMLTTSAMSQLAAHLRSVGADPAVRVIVLTGSGSTFCAGADLRGASTADAASFTGSGPSALVEVLEAILDNPKPVIARVQGHVAGGGERAGRCGGPRGGRRFGQVRVLRGPAGPGPGVISVVCLVRMHRARAQELLLTGARVPAARMVSAGLLNRVVAEEERDAVVAEWVAALSAGGPQALAHTKALLREVPGMPRAQAFEHTAALSAERFVAEEAADGIRAFLTRTPSPGTRHP